MYLRETVGKLRETVNEIELHSSSEYSEDLETEYNDAEVEPEIGNQEWGIFDQLMLNPDRLHDLQEIQSEIKGSKLTDINEEVMSETIEEIVPEINDEIIPEKLEDEIKFTNTENISNECEFILKSGKNKGMRCNKINCKTHR